MERKRRRRENVILKNFQATKEIHKTTFFLYGKKLEKSSFHILTSLLSLSLSLSLFATTDTFCFYFSFLLRSAPAKKKTQSSELELSKANVSTYVSALSAARHFFSRPDSRQKRMAQSLTSI